MCTACTSITQDIQSSAGSNSFTVATHQEILSLLVETFNFIPLEGKKEQT
jgi:hypothetical protein